MRPRSRQRWLRGESVTENGIHVASRLTHRPFDGVELVRARFRTIRHESLFLFAMVLFVGPSGEPLVSCGRHAVLRKPVKWCRLSSLPADGAAFHRLACARWRNRTGGCPVFQL
jgi:hypothetical protein